MQYNAIQYNIMQCHKETKYTIWYNKMQFNTLQYCTIAYDTFQTKREHYWLKKGPFWAIGARKWPAEQSNGHLVENRRHPELPQDMWMLWSHWAGSIWGEIRGLFGSSVEKNWFSGQKCIFWGQNPNFFERHQIFCYHHDKTPKRQLDPVAIGTSGWPLHSLFGSKRAILVAIGTRKLLAEQPNGHVTENRRYPELPQNMGKLWYHRVEFVWGQKNGLYGRSVEKGWFIVNFIKIGNF